MSATIACSDFSQDPSLLVASVTSSLLIELRDFVDWCATQELNTVNDEASRCGPSHLGLARPEISAFHRQAALPLEIDDSCWYPCQGSSVQMGPPTCLLARVPASTCNVHSSRTNRLGHCCQKNSVEPRMQSKTSDQARHPVHRNLSIPVPQPNQVLKMCWKSLTWTTREIGAKHESTPKRLYRFA